MLTNEDQYSENSWGSWQRHVLTELKRLSASQERANEISQKANEDLKAENALIWREIVVMKVKLAGWGMLGGLITTLTTIMLYLLIQALK